VPVIGASGAIAGVSGAYFLFFATSRVITLIPIFLFLQVVEIPAVLFLLVWFLWQVASGVATLGHAAGGAVGGVAGWAHGGGFRGGMVLGPVLGRRRAN